jgi:hypothetical protein
MSEMDIDGTASFLFMPSLANFCAAQLYSRSWQGQNTHRE